MSGMDENQTPRHSIFAVWCWPRRAWAAIAFIWLVILAASAIPVRVTRVFPPENPGDDEYFQCVVRWPLWGYERPATIEEAKEMFAAEMSKRSEQGVSEPTLESPAEPLIPLAAPGSPSEPPIPLPAPAN
jgi:hypothetical protein